MAGIVVAPPLGQGRTMADPQFVAVAAVADVPPGTVKAVEVAGRSILLCHDEGRIYALENRCSHAEQPLECGRVRWGWISCPMHGARFDLASGEVLRGPAVEPIETFAVRMLGNTIEVAL